MSSTYADLIVRLRNARQAKRDAQQVAGGVRSIRDAAKEAGAATRKFGADIGSSLATGVRRGAFAVAILTAAGTKMGLAYNAQIESARERFRLFTDDIDGLTRSVQAIDAHSQFNFGGLSDAAAMFGNSGIKDIPRTLQAAANAAAASGKGEEALKGIVIALSQIQAKSKLSQEEINQLNEAGAPGAQAIIQKAFGLTAKQLSNLGGQGLDATKAIDALTDAWTSGRMAQAAERQLHTLGGQWQLFTGNVQKLSGAATKGLSDGLEHDVLPAANRAVSRITDIFGNEGLSDRQKLRQARDVIRQELGPVAQDLIKDIKDADLAGKLNHEFESAMDKMASTAVTRAPNIVGSFVDAWLGAGPWAKLISGAWFAHKLGLDKGAIAALKALGNGSGRKNPLGGAGRGATAANPVWVSIVGGPGGGLPVGPAKEGTKLERLLVGGSAGATGAVFAAGAAGAFGLTKVPGIKQFYDSLGKGGSNEHLLRDFFTAKATPGQTGGMAGPVPLPVPSAPSTLNPFTTHPLGPVFPARPTQVVHVTKLEIDGKVITEIVDDHISDAKARR